MMSDAYIPLETVAVYENIPYNTLVQRMKRNPAEFKTKEVSRESGRPRTLVSVASLSPKARKLYRAERKTQTLQGDDLVIEALAGKAPPWYVEIDFHWYMANYPEQFAQAAQTAEQMRAFTDYAGDDRTGYAEEFAAAHGMTPRTLYRMSQAYLTASAWALKLERETGRSHDHVKTLALCRKPRETNTFPSLSAEQKALVENIWFNEKFRRNRGTIQMLYEKLAEKCEGADEPYPSYPTVARYIDHLMQDRNGD